MTGSAQGERFCNASESSGIGVKYLRQTMALARQVSPSTWEDSAAHRGHSASTSAVAGRVSMMSEDRATGMGADHGAARKLGVGRLHSPTGEKGRPDALPGAMIRTSRDVGRLHSSHGVRSTTCTARRPEIFN